MPTPYIWSLDAPPTPTSVADTSDGTAALLSGASGRSRRGILAPLRRGASDFVSGEGAQLINSMIRQVCGTRCSSAKTQGELAWRTDFGSLIDHARWRNNDDVLEALLNQWTVDAVARWLKTVRITRTLLVRENDANGQETVARLRIWWEAVSRGGQIVGTGSTSVPLPAVARP